ncbi:MAG: transporter, partial [Bacteroidetes bacterium]|nr:transporter [Bacteroidota bacterium]
IDKDRKIISLQEDIVKQASNQMQQGVIPGATYITEVNKELQAKLNLKIHEIKLAEARINLLTETGNINEL